MFEIGWSELLVIAVVAIIVVGPKDLPRMMRTFGHYVGKLRRMASDFQRQFEEAVKESELEDVKKAIQSVSEATPSLDLKAPVDRPLMLPNQTAQGDGTIAAATAAPAARVTAKPKAKPRAKSPATKKPAAKPQGRKPAKGKTP